MLFVFAPTIFAPFAVYNNNHLLCVVRFYVNYLFRTVRFFARITSFALFFFTSTISFALFVFLRQSPLSCCSFCAVYLVRFIRDYIDHTFFLVFLLNFHRLYRRLKFILISSSFYTECIFVWFLLRYSKRTLFEDTFPAFLNTFTLHTYIYSVRR